MAALTMVLALALSAFAAPAKGPAAKATGQPKPAGPRLVLKAQAEPAVAQPGQPVSVRLRWMNEGPKGGGWLIVNRRGLLGREVQILLRSAAKPLVALKAPADLGPPEDHDFQRLAPGDSFEYEYPLVPEQGGSLPPGAYDVRVVYKNLDGADRDPPAWTGTLEATTKVRVLPVR